MAQSRWRKSGRFQRWTSAWPTASGSGFPMLREVRWAALRGVIQRALAATDGIVSGAAELLGVSRPTPYDLLVQHELKIRDME